jgi:eukaryotic-like serine/threonine-protein kinase
MLLEGQQCSHYRLIKLLKRGGMGEVYLGEDTRLNRQVAIKVIYTDSASPFDPKAAQEAVRLFFREARVIAQFDHVHILPLYDSGEDIINETKVMYMVMPLRQEGSFADWWIEHAQKNPLPLPAVERVVRQAAEALQHAHDRQVVHKDVKPSNFLVRGRAEHPSQLDLQLADFGIARIALVTTSESQSIRGTPSYMAPEQWNGDPVPATDQYALAVMAYELLTGRNPFEGGGYQQLWYQHNTKRPERPSSINPSIPREIDEILLRALEKDPRQRFSSISVFAHAFQRAVINSGNIQRTVKVSPFEARVGTVRLLLLADGREVTVPVPAGAYQGQIIRLEGNGRPTTYDGSCGALLVTIAIHEEAAPPPTSYANYIEPTVPVFPPTVHEEIPLPPVPASPRRVQSSGGGLKIGIALVCLLLLSGSLCYTVDMRYQANATNTAQQVAAVTASAKASNHATAVADAGTATSSTATAQAQATAAVVQENPLPAYFSGNGTLALKDSLTDDRSNLWVQATASASTPKNGNCMPLHGGLDASVGVTPTNGVTNVDAGITFHPCIKQDMTQPANYLYGNFAYEVNMTINQGDCGGIVFRAKNQAMYYFVICSTGTYRLVRYLGDSQGSTMLIPGSSSSPDPTSLAINTGLTVNNTIAVEARGTHIDLYVNQAKVASIDDASYSSGYVGVIAKSLSDAANDPTDVVFTNVRVWNLSA